MTLTKHYTNDRQARAELIKRIGTGKPIGYKIIDRGHKNGAEKHVITDNAIVYVFNVRTGKLVTTLIARPNQLKRYYGEGKCPQTLLDIAYEHQRLGYNMV